VRRVTLKRPFSGGMVTDVPAHELGPTFSPFAQDGFSPNGVFRQRWGWAYDGTTADVADNLVGVFRNKFILSDVTRTATVDDDGTIFVHNASSSGTALITGSQSYSYLPRCVYRDQVVFCATDGVTSAKFWSGANTAVRSYATGTPTFTSRRSDISGTNTFATTTPVPGEYVYFRNAGGAAPPIVSARVLEATSDDSVTIEDAMSSATIGADAVSVAAYGSSIPCVSVYSAGTASISGSTATGFGTKWSTGDWGTVTTTDGFVAVPTTGGTFEVAAIETVTDDDTMTVFANVWSSRQPYHITRRCPFKDAQSHKGSLWGTGVAQYPNRVYVSPPNWNPAYPPGLSIPVDVGSYFGTENINDLFLDFIDVPSSTDGDDNIAILASPNPLLVLKRNAVYGVFGSYPTFSVDLVADGVGCIDISSSLSYDEGQ
jgi:hypothetical protein